jgi:death-on-curing protein
MKFVKREDVIKFNKGVIEKYTGTFMPPTNLKNAEGLDYLLDICENNEIFGVAQYPTVAHVAALLLYKITDNHLFNDGNKRTAYTTAYYFLHLNGYRFKERVQTVVDDNGTYIPRKIKTNTTNTLEQLIQEIAQSLLTYEDVYLFVERNIEEKKLF